MRTRHVLFYRAARQHRHESPPRPQERFWLCLGIGCAAAFAAPLVAGWLF